MEKIQVVLASPSDLAGERQMIKDLVNTLNPLYMKNGICIDLRMWENSTPGMNADGPQGLIDMDLEITNADLFICEGMYGEEGKEKKAREYKHMTFYEAAHLAKEADVKQMWLTHYSPSLVRAEEFMGKVKSIFPRAKAGKDGKTITLDFQEE